MNTEGPYYGSEALEYNTRENWRAFEAQERSDGWFGFLAILALICGACFLL